MEDLLKIDKDHPFYDRFKLILSDPLNNKIKRIDQAGKIVNGNVLMYNGLKIIPESYCGNFSDILLINGGVHEPQEEYVFVKVIENIKSKNPVMVELGSYWAFYSMSFLNKNKDGVCYLIEEDPLYLEVGRRHFELNGLTGNFIREKISNVDLSIDFLMQDKGLQKIDILHSDIQGYEHQMLDGAIDSLHKRKIDYIFISTHSQEIHYKCLDFLNKVGYKLIGSADFDYQTFCHDGIIIACSPDIDFDYVDLGDRSNMNIIGDDEFNKIIRSIK
jgi:hypothetical protein